MMIIADAPRTAPTVTGTKSSFVDADKMLTELLPVLITAKHI